MPAVSGKSTTTAQASTAPKPAVTSNSAAKKSPQSTVAPASKLTMPPKSSTATSSSVPAPARRTSMLPGKSTVPPARPSTLSASTSGKLSSAASSSPTAKPIRAAPPRSSVASPESAAAPRPRASVTDGLLPKKAAAPRAGLAPSAKQPSASVRPARAPGTSSISSLKEVKEDSATLAEIQNKVHSMYHSSFRKSKNSDLVPVERSNGIP